MTPDIYERLSLPRSESMNPTYDVVDRIEYGDGIKVYLQNHIYPIHGIPTVEAIQSINVVKKVLSLQFIKAAEIAIEPYTLKPEYMHHASRELRRIFPGRIGQLVAWVIEYDAAYRLRFLDLMTESSKDALIWRPIREIWRLLKINKRRDQAVVHAKFRYVAIVLTLAMLVPTFRSAWKRALKNCTMSSLQMDEADKYWLKLRSDYDYRA